MIVTSLIQPFDLLPTFFITIFGFPKYESYPKMQPC